MNDVQVKFNDEDGSAIVKVNGRQIPHVYSYNIKHDIIGEYPVIDLELSGNSIFFEGKAKVNIKDLVCSDKDMAQQIHDILEEEYDIE